MLWHHAGVTVVMLRRSWLACLGGVDLHRAYLSLMTKHVFPLSLLLCRGERVKGLEGPLAKPVRVAIKELQPGTGHNALIQLRQEAAVLKALSGKPYTVCFHSCHIYTPSPGHVSGYLVMG